MQRDEALARLRDITRWSFSLPGDKVVVQWALDRIAELEIDRERLDWLQTADLQKIQWLSSIKGNLRKAIDDARKLGMMRGMESGEGS
jgi:hypothetical protein